MRKRNSSISVVWFLLYFCFSPNQLKTIQHDCMTWKTSILSSHIKTEGNVQADRRRRSSVSKSLSKSLCCFSALYKPFCFRFCCSLWFHLCLALFHSRSLQPDRQLLTLGGTPWVLDPKPAMSVLHSRAPDTYVRVRVHLSSRPCWGGK